MPSPNIRLKKQLEQEGYSVLTGIFSREEIRWMRTEAKAVLASASPVNGGLNSGAVPLNSALANRLLNNPVLAQFFDKYPYAVHVHANTYNDWHRDTVRIANSAESDSSAWIYKVAIYLQDHTGQDGLSILPGSHKANSVAVPPRHLSTRAGDIVVFDTRMRHAGRLPSLTERLVRNLGSGLFRVGLLDYRGYQALLRRLGGLLPSRPERLAILVASAVFERQATERLTRWKRGHRDPKKWRLLRPPPWQTVP